MTVRHVPNPVATAVIMTVDNVDTYRKLDCKIYDRCLDVAVVQQWGSFACEACTAYARAEPMPSSRDEYKAMHKFLQARKS